MVHVGSLIKKEIYRQNVSVLSVARRLYCDRSNVYDIFTRESVDVALLIRLSLLLHHDFFKDILESMGDEWPFDEGASD